ncbi:gliding motility protein GldM [Chitinophaga sp. Cy-1792]|uniref:type IX secretion system motor protein PorM/GldM n=1 Tax=Chitinophaga sp. Cy-1792 TaxID=2608339 RepID=UPI001422B02B|nr:gliding motility protein GldM [Chitinophaga sp. Cy-1792]NIG52673.1 gliding motility protein GldM [Chitinophaga sp. Cy-1792]
MALPKDPRQKMINIMYLVLTAMLALNVSAEILNAFSIVNNSIINSNSSLAAKNAFIYEQFAKQMEGQAEKVGPYKAKAEQVKAASKEVYDFIENLKDTIIKQSDGLDENGEIKGKSNLDVPTYVMENQKQGPALEAKLIKLREQLLSYVNPDKKAQFDKSLPLRVEVGKSIHGGDAKKSWTTYHFNMVPTVAAVTLLSKFQNDIKNSESAIIDDLFKQISEKDFKFDQIRPFVSLNSKNLMEGQTVTAQIAVGAYSTTVNPSVTVNGQTIEAKDGLATYTTQVGGIGEKTISGTISLPDPTGGAAKSYPFSETYNVGASATAISADKMNVLYIGVQNPISITAAGVPAEKVSATIAGAGNITKTGAGNYVVTVSQTGKATINVVANIDGKTRDLGKKEFRVKRVPDPSLQVGNYKGGTVKAAEFRNQMGVRAVLEDFEFEGVKYDVVSYRVGIESRGKDYVEGDASSPYFPANIAGAIRALRPGDIVHIESPKVKGPDGVVRTMANTMYKLN